MSVTADQIEAVAEHAEAVHLVGAAQQLRGRAAHVRLVEAQPTEVVELAAAIRNAYYNDGVRRELLSSRDPGQWLRMAVEAKSALGVGAVLPRVFNVGDPEPEDRDSITLRGGIYELTYCEDPTAQPPLRSGMDWWQIDQVETSNSTYAKWDYWLEHHGPLTEVLDELKSKTPRTFKWRDDEPVDIAYAYDEDGELFKRLGPDTWAMHLGDGRYGDSRFDWSEVTVGAGATEAFGDLG